MSWLSEWLSKSLKPVSEKIDLKAQTRSLAEDALRELGANVWKEMQKRYTLPKSQKAIFETFWQKEQKRLLDKWF